MASDVITRLDSQYESNRSTNEKEYIPTKLNQTKDIEKLMKENDGLKGFVNIVKNKHPEVFQSIYHSMKEIQEKGLSQESQADKDQIKVEELEI